MLCLASVPSRPKWPVAYDTGRFGTQNGPELTAAGSAQDFHLTSLFCICDAKISFF